MNNYHLAFSKSFLRDSKKLIEKNEKLKVMLHHTLSLLKIDPYFPTLRSHKVIGRLTGEAHSSWVNGDVRVLWEFDQKEIKLLNVLAIGGHSGAHKIYNVS